MPRPRCEGQSAIPGLGTDHPPKSVKKRKTIVNLKNKWTLSPLGFDPDLSGPVGAVSNRAASAQLETVPTKRETGRCGFQPHRFGVSN